MFKSKKLLTIFLAVLVVAGCKAENAVVTIYTSDIEEARSGKVIDVPLKATFSIIGEDKENLLGKATAIAQKYLSKGSKISRSKSQFGERLVIETKIPLAKLGPYKKYVENKGKRLAAVGVFGNKLYFVVSKPGRESLNKELRQINYMLSLDKIIKRATYRIISDSKKQFEISAYAAWVAKKPYLYYKKILNRRDEAELTFKGDDGSIYSQLKHYITVK